MQIEHEELAGALAMKLHYPSDLIKRAARWAIDDLVGAGVDVFSVKPADVSERISLVLDTNLRMWGVGIEDVLNAHGRSAWVSDVARAFGEAQAKCRPQLCASVL